MKANPYRDKHIAEELTAALHEAAKGMKLHKIMHVCGTHEHEIGRYGTMGPRSLKYSRNTLAIRDDWNALSNQSRLRIQKGGLLIEGTTAPKLNIDGSFLPGGGHQLFVPDLTDLIL